MGTEREMDGMEEMIITIEGMGEAEAEVVLIEEDVHTQDLVHILHAKEITIIEENMIKKDTRDLVLVLILMV